MQNPRRDQDPALRKHRRFVQEGPSGTPVPTGCREVCADFSLPPSRLRRATSLFRGGKKWLPWGWGIRTVGDAGPFGLPRDLCGFFSPSVSPTASHLPRQREARSGCHRFVQQGPSGTPVPTAYREICADFSLPPSRLRRATSLVRGRQEVVAVGLCKKDRRGRRSLRVAVRLREARKRVCLPFGKQTLLVVC